MICSFFLHSQRTIWSQETKKTNDKEGIRTLASGDIALAGQPIKTTLAPYQVKLFVVNVDGGLKQMNGIEGIVSFLWMWTKNTTRKGFEPSRPEAVD